MQRAFIFDMDGTLMDNLPFHDRIWFAFTRRHGLSLSEEEVAKLAYGTGREAIKRIFGEMPDAEADRMAGEKESLYREYYRPHIEARPGLEAFLEKTRSLGISVGLGTAGDMGNVDFALDGLGVRPFFEKISSAEDVLNGKPDPEVFLKAAEKLGVRPADCLVFEDSRSGLEAAHRAGMAAVAVATDGFMHDTSGWPRLLLTISNYEFDPSILLQMLDAERFLKSELPSLLANLHADTPAKWGKMTAQHMVEHLSGTVIISNGKFAWPGGADGTEWGRQHRAEMFAPGYDSYPHHVVAPGVPETPAALRFPDIETAKGKFLAEIDRFFDHFSKNPEARPVHPVFGPLEFSEWKTAHMVHFRHHFKQFGLIPDSPVSAN